MRIKNWEKFQHFKDRKPIWIKLYRDILDDDEWHDLEAEAAKVLVMLWLLASESEGELPQLKKIAFRLRMKESQVNQLIGKLGHWLIFDDTKPISLRHQSFILETETETETEKRESAHARKPTLDNFELDDELREYAKPLHAESELEHFKDHHRAKGTKLRDVRAAFRNWIRMGKKFAAEKPQNRAVEARNDSSRRSAVIENTKRRYAEKKPIFGTPDITLLGSLLVSGELTREEAEWAGYPKAAAA